MLLNHDEILAYMLSIKVIRAKHLYSQIISARSKYSHTPARST